MTMLTFWSSTILRGGGLFPSSRSGSLGHPQGKLGKRLSFEPPGVVRSAKQGAEHMPPSACGVREWETEEGVRWGWEKAGPPSHHISV